MYFSYQHVLAIATGASTAFASSSKTTPAGGSILIRSQLVATNYPSVEDSLANHSVTTRRGEGQICPPDDSDDQPSCEDATCAGVNGRCTTGVHIGCTCEAETCPDLSRDHFFCKECGGADEAGKCKGEAEFEYTWKGCECTPDIDWSLQPLPLRRPNAAKHQQALLNLPKITYAPEASSCVKRTIVDCAYHYEDLPNVPMAQCPPVPALPATCSKSDPSAVPVPTPAPSTSPELPPPALGTQNCHGVNAFGEHGDVRSQLQDDNSAEVCELWDDNGKGVMDATSVELTANPNDWWDEANFYRYSLGWIKDCKTAAAKQNVNKPLGEAGPDCRTLLRESYSNCHNEGTGGYRDAGCLRYTFTASRTGIPI